MKTERLFYFLILIIVLTIGGYILNKDNSNTTISILLKPLTQNRVLDPVLVRFVTEYEYLSNMTVRLIDINKSGEYVNSLC